MLLASLLRANANLSLPSNECTIGGMSRREFTKFCAGVAATMGLPQAAGLRMAEAAATQARPPVIWLHGQECTGCTESLLRAEHPTLESLILDLISLEYHETLCAGAGHQAEAHKQKIMQENKGKYILVTEGGTPTKDNGIFCKVAGKTQVDQVREAADGAAAIIAIGSCASWGGIQSADPNPTGAKPTQDIVPGKVVINIPGCPPNPYNFISTVLHLLTFNKPPDLDEKNRPKFAYGRLIHENCERRPHFDAGRFALEFGDLGHRQGWCLYKIGCKGPETYANCPAIGFGDVGFGSWPVGTGHPCFGCTEKETAFHKPIHALATVKTHTPPTAFPTVEGAKGWPADPAAVAIIAGIGGALIGAGAVAASRMRGTPANEDDASKPKS
ncbi:MAG: hydrogenase small subunit [Rhodoplanes sp.]